MDIKKLFQLFAEEAEATGVDMSAAGSVETNEEVVPSLDDEFGELVKGKYKEAFGSRVENIVKSRLKSKSEEVNNLTNYKDSVSPLLEHLADTYGCSNDLDEILQAVQSDKSYLTERALETGDDPDDIFKGNRQRRIEAEEARQKESEAEKMREQLEEINRQNQFQGWVQAKSKEADEFKKNHPEYDFDFDDLSQNEKFRNNLAKLDNVEGAYFATFGNDILKRTGETIQAKLSSRANEGRPTEAGAGGSAATSSKVDVSRLSSKDIMAILKRVEGGEVIEF